MVLTHCSVCRKGFDDKSEEGKAKFCSKACEDKSKRAVWTTMSVLHTTRNRLIILQNEILTKVNYKISYTKLIEHILDILNKELGTGKVADKIVSEFNYI